MTIKEGLSHMIQAQLIDRDISDARVIKAFRQTDRTLFVPDGMQKQAYEDRPLPLIAGQTISQPYIVAYMAQALQLQPDDKVLEVGTGCGYNAAILSHLVREVYSVERIAELVAVAHGNLRRCAITNVHIRQGDGSHGWSDFAPYDAIVLTAAAATIPPKLLEQLKPGGRLLAPVGSRVQYLKLVFGSDAAYREQTLLPVQFVPLI